METVVYELQLWEGKADYVTFTGNPKNPHLLGLKIQLPVRDWEVLGKPQTVDVIVGKKYSAIKAEAAPAPKAKGKKK